MPELGRNKSERASEAGELAGGKRTKRIKASRIAKWQNGAVNLDGIGKTKRRKVWQGEAEGG